MNWIPIERAAGLVAEFQPIGDARNNVLGAIAENLVKARAFRKRKTSLSFQPSDTAWIERSLATGKWVHELSFSYISGDGDRRVIEDDCVFDGFCAYQFIDALDGEWTRKSCWEMFNRREVQADWQSGHFHTRSIATGIDSFDIDAMESGSSYYLREEDFYSVEVEEEAIRRIVVGKSYRPDAPPLAEYAEPQATKFDWEAAFADVAAALHWSVEFENINARGTPAIIVDLLVASFERRNTAVPGNTILKAKAAKIAGALRSHKD